MDQSTAAASASFGRQSYIGGTMEFDAYQEDMSVEYIEGGTRALNMLNWAGEASKPPAQFAILGDVFA